MGETLYEEEKQAAGLSRKLFWAPSPRRSAVAIGILSIVFGTIAVYEWGTPLAHQPEVLWGCIAVFIASLATTFITFYYGKRVGIMYWRRAYLLTFFGLLSVSGSAILGAIVPGRPGHVILMLGIASPVWTRLSVLTATCNPKQSVNMPSAFLHTIAIAIALQPFRGYAYFEVLTLIASSIGFLIGGVLFLAIVSGPMKRVFGITPMWLLVHGLEHFTTRGGLDAESFFHSISAKTNAWFSFIRIRRKGTTMINLFTTSLHPGPFGLYGGSNMPTKLKEMTGWPSLLCFHGPSGHESNPPRTNDLMKVAKRLEKEFPNLEFTAEASEPVVEQRGSIKLTAQRLGKIAFITSTTAPEACDDIDYATGQCAMERIRKWDNGVDSAFFVDAHNSLEQGAGCINMGDTKSSDMLDASAELRLGSSKPLRAGYSQYHSLKFEDDISEQGVQALVIEAGGHRTAYVLMDGNNLLKEYRDALVSEIEDIVDHAEIYTTDNHAVNAYIGGFRPIGMETPIDVLKVAVKTAVRDAVSDLADAEAGGAEFEIEDFPVLGPGTTAKLTAMVNATYGVVKPGFITSMAVALLIGLIPFLLY